MTNLRLVLPSSKEHKWREQRIVKEEKGKGLTYDSIYIVGVQVIPIDLREEHHYREVTRNRDPTTLQLSAVAAAVLGALGGRVWRPEYLWGITIAYVCED